MTSGITSNQTMTSCVPNHCHILSHCSKKSLNCDFVYETRRIADALSISNRAMDRKVASIAAMIATSAHSLMYFRPPHFRPISLSYCPTSLVRCLSNIVEGIIAEKAIANQCVLADFNEGTQDGDSAQWIRRSKIHGCSSCVDFQPSVFKATALS